MNTDEFADAVIERLGQLPTTFPVAEFKSAGSTTKVACFGEQKHRSKKTLVGVDIFLDSTKFTAAELGEALQIVPGRLQLQTITCLGVKVWPNGISQTAFGDHCCCRFQISKDFEACLHQEIVDLLQHFNDKNLDVIKTENLYCFDGVRGFSLAQGQ